MLEDELEDVHDDFCDFDNEEDEEYEFCRGDHIYAYQGYGPVCLERRCEHWGRDGICNLAIEIEIAEQEGAAPPKGRCSLVCPNCG